MDEGLDEEEREALELTLEDLLAMWEAGRPAKLARKEPADIRRRREEREREAAQRAGDRKRSV